MKNVAILVPLDFSDLSNIALKTAEYFARLFDGKLTPYHAYIPITDLDGFYYMGMGFSGQDNFTEVENILQDRLNEVGEQYVDERYLNPGVIDVGNPAKAIAGAADEYDLIVMSTHGRTGFTRMFIGSTAEKVLRTCHTPVIVVEESSRVDPMERIMVTTDFSEPSFKVFPLVSGIAQAAGSQVDLIHVVSNVQLGDDETLHSATKSRHKELEFLADEHFSAVRNQINCEAVPSGKSPHEAIHDLNMENDYNLVAMSSIGRTGLDYMMMGSTASNVVRNVKSAVLSLNPRRKETPTT